MCSNLSIYLSIGSLAISLVSLILHFVNYCKTKAKLKIYYDKSDSFYFDGIDASNGNRESLVISVRISNCSNQPIDISCVDLIIKKDFSTPNANVSCIRYPEWLADDTFATHKDENGNLELKAQNGDGYTFMGLKNNLITTPLRLEPYECVQGLLLFPQAGISKRKVTLKFITSRKKFTKRLYVITKDEHEHWFS